MQKRTGSQDIKTKVRQKWGNLGPNKDAAGLKTFQMIFYKYIKIPCD
jgi:hypothetical protein